MITLRQDILTEAYQDLKLLICKVSWNHHRKFGGDIEDIIADANLIFVEACNDYEAAKSEIGTWVFFRIEKKLLDIETKKYKERKAELPNLKREVEQLVFGNIATEMIDLIDNLSAEIRHIVQIALTPGGNPKTVRTDLKKKLTSKGWTWENARSGIKELQEVLSA